MGCCLLVEKFSQVPGVEFMDFGITNGDSFSVDFHNPFNWFPSVTWHQTASGLLGARGRFVN